MRLLDSQQAGFTRSFARLRAGREEDTARADEVAREIVAQVREHGDRALLEYTKRFDRVDLLPSSLRVDEREIREAYDSVPAEVRVALRRAATRIRAFHKRQRQSSWHYRDGAGLLLGQQITPLERVGVYVPGGRAAYPSSVLMNVLPARVAGVDEVIMVSPAGAKGHNASVLAAAHIAGASAVYRIGGAQAVAALAYGTRTVPRVDKVVGPGNAFVQAAKRLVYGQVDIDSTAGPSEVLVIADAKANPVFVAVDLLAQAEHGSGDESALLLSPSRRLIAAVEKEINARLQGLSRRRDIERVLRRRGALVRVRNLREAIELAEQVAPEHLELLVENPLAVARRLRNAGAIFAGPFSPAPLGDYVAGPNHVLPTGGTARFFSPLGVYDFVKRTSIVSATRAGLAELAPVVETLAELEGYDAHAAAVRARFEPSARRAKGTPK